MKNSIFHKLLSIGVFSIFMIGLCAGAFGQTIKTLPDTSKLAYNALSKGLNLYVFPAKGQSQQKQKEDEFECYKWAADQSGIDPLNPPKVEAAPVKSGPNGSAVRGAAGGAAAGAAIGAIAGDAGEGAAIGAVAGGLRGIRKGREANAQANAKAEQEVQAKKNEIAASYIKAFQVCIEGKGYTIK